MKSSVTLVQDCIDIVPVERVDVVLGRYDDVLCNELRLDEAQIIEYMFYKRRQAIAPEAELRRGSSTSIRYGKPFRSDDVLCNELRLDEAQIIEYMFYKRRQAIAPEAELRRGSSTSIRYGKPF